MLLLIYIYFKPIFLSQYIIFNFQLFLLYNYAPSVVPINKYLQGLIIDYYYQVAILIHILFRLSIRLTVPLVALTLLSLKVQLFKTTNLWSFKSISRPMSYPLSSLEYYLTTICLSEQFPSCPFICSTWSIFQTLFKCMFHKFFSTSKKMILLLIFPILSYYILFPYPVI